MSKHTPGPWEAIVDGTGAWHVTAGPWAPDAVTRARYQWLTPNLAPVPGKPLYGPNGQVHTVQVGEGEANARLMAAAPDLLEALKVLHSAHRAFSSAENWTSYDDDARATAEAAIARAEGRD